MKINSGAYENILHIGISKDATDDFDYGMDVPLIPQTPAQKTIGYFSYSGAYGKLSKDVRQKNSHWTLHLTENAQISIIGDHRIGTISISDGENSISLGGGETISLDAGEYKIFWNPDISSPLPERTTISKIYPNPFNSVVQISINLAEDRGELQIMDIGGRIVKMFELSGSGSHHILWNAKTQDSRDLPSGLYFVRLRSGEKSVCRGKILLVR